MAQQALSLGLKGVPLVAEHYDKVTDPLAAKAKQGIQKVKKEMRNNQGHGYESDGYDAYDRYGPPQRSQTERRRRSPRDDYRPRHRSGRDDVEDDRYAYSRGNGRARSVGGKRGSRRDYSDSESSLSPPRRERRKSLGEKALVALGLGGAAGAEADKKHRSRDRRLRSRRRGSTPSSDSEGYYVRKDNRTRGPPANGGGGYYDDRTPNRYKPAAYIRDRDDRDSSRGQELTRRNNNQSTVGSSTNGAFDQYRGKKRDSSSSPSSSDVSCSSSEDERRTKKIKGKEYLTAGLAAVATIHAAHGLYSSMEARDKRHMEVLKGEMSPEEARKKKNKARLQDAAAIAIAGLGIKGAYSEWQEVQESRSELTAQNAERKQRHEKRMRKAKKMLENGGDRDGGDGYGRSRSEGPSRRDRYRDHSR